MRNGRRQYLLLAGLMTVAIALPGTVEAKRRAVGGTGNPRAFNDTYAIVRGSVYESRDGAGVLANDVERDNLRLLSILLVRPRQGTVTLRADGSFTYTHSGSPAAVDTFVYKANNGTTDSAPATVTLNITNASPPRTSSDSYSVANHGVLEITAPGVLQNDTGDAALSAMLAAGPAHGSVVLSADGAFTYAHDGSNSSSDAFTYRASDGASTSAATSVSLTILATTTAGSGPVVIDHSYTVAQATPLVVPAPGLLAGASDPDTPLTQLTAVVTAAPLHGTVTAGSDGAFTYVPAPTYAGADSFTFAASDGANTSASATASISVLAGAFANADFYDVTQDQARNVDPPGVLQNDAADLKITSYGGTTGKEQTAIGSLTATMHGGAVRLSGDGSFTYIPPPFYAGTDSFAYYGSNSVGVTSAVVTLTVYGRPVARGDAYTVVHDTDLQISAPGVLGNDTLYGAAISSYSSAQHGLLTLLANGSLQYRPNLGFGGADTFTYTVQNPVAGSTASVEIYVYQPPVTVNDVFASMIAFDGNPLINDTVTRATVFSYGASTGMETTTIGATAATSLGGTVAFSASGTFHYTPPPGNATDSFKYILKNPAGISVAATVTIFRKPAPVAVNDSYLFSDLTASVLANDTRNDAEIVGNGASVPTAQGGSVVLDANGFMTYTPPPAGTTASDSFMYKLRNPAGESTATVTIALLPTAVDDLRGPILELTYTDPAPGVLAGDIQNGGAITSYGITGTETVTLGTTVPTALGGTIRIFADGLGGFEYNRPAAPPALIDTFKYVLTNSRGSSTATVTFLLGF
jgi:VCBS repeat-containing protein